MPSSDTQWKPGQSGNPAGGKNGECKKYQLFKQIVEPRVPELVEQAINIALSSSKDRTRVLSIFLERVLPRFALESLTQSNSKELLKEAEHIKNLVAEKAISPEQGSVLLSNLKITAEIKYKEDLEKELEELKSEFKTFRDKFGK